MTNGALIDEPLSEREELFNAFFEGELNDDDHAAFEQRLDDDETFRREYEEFFRIMGGLRELPFEFAPDDFVERVQTRIRTRSRGRFFADQYLYKSRVPYEVVCVVMIIVMAAAYFMMGVPADAGMQDVKVNPSLNVPE